MRTFFAFFLSFFALANTNQAQEKFNPKKLPTYNPKSYQKGEAVRKPTNFSFPVLVTTTKDNYYLVFTSFTGLRGVIFDKNLKNITPNKKAIELNFEVNGEKARFQSLYSIQDKLYAFTIVYDKRADTKILYCQSVDPKTLIPARTGIEVAKMTEVEYAAGGDFNIQPSMDSSRLLIYADMPRRRKDNAAYALTVLNADMQIMWNKTVEMPYEENLFKIEDFVVDNESNVYLMAKLYKERPKEKRRGEVNYSYKILPFSSKGEQLSEKTVELDEKKFVEQVTLVKSNNILRCIGFYSNKVNADAAGLFYLELDEQLAIKKAAYKDLSIEDIESGDGLNRKFWSKKAVDDLLLRNYKVRFVFSKSDGSLQLVAEQNWVATVTSYDPRTGRSSTRYISVFGPIVIINISEQGEIQWVSFIKKSETINGIDHSSHVSCSVGAEGSRFYFNDNAKNFNPNRKGIYRTVFKFYTTSAVLIDNNGKQIRQAIQGIDKKDGYLLCQLSRWDGNDNMYFLRWLFKKKQFRIDKMELAD